jgi:tetratricopeptide (TPR) repeat protein
MASERGPRASEARGDLAKIPKTAPEHLLAVYHLAYLARLDSDEAGEEKLWEQAVREHPEDPTARLMLVLSWKRTEQLAKRLESFGHEAAAQKADRGRRLLEGMALEEAGRSAEALRVYADAFRAAPGDPEISARLSNLAGRSPERIPSLLGEKPADSSQGTSVPPCRRRAAARAAGRGDGTQGRGDPDPPGGLARLPNRSEVALSLGVLSAQMGRGGEDPDALIAKAIELDPRSPWPLLQKGLRLLKSQDGKGAIAAAEKALAIAPDLVEAWQLAGSARRDGRRSRRAAKDLSRALLLDPADSLGVTRFQLSLALAAAGDRPAARQALEGDLPPFPDLIYRLAWSFTGGTFLDRNFHGQDWQALRDRFPDPHASPARAYAAVAAMLQSLGDPYTRLRSAEETTSIYLRLRTEKLETDAQGAPLPTSGTVLTRDLGEDIGYLRLTSFSDPSSREAIRKALEKMAMEQGPGAGFARQCRRAGRRGRRGRGHASRGRGDPGSPAHRVGRGGPEGGAGPAGAQEKPMVILTDRRTGSAAEKLASGLQGSGRATVLGEGTFGKGVGQISRLLPGGPMMLVTAVESLTAAGDTLQGRGVVPDIPSEEDESIEKAREI